MVEDAVNSKVLFCKEAGKISPTCNYGTSLKDILPIPSIKLVFELKKSFELSVEVGAILYPSDRHWKGTTSTRQTTRGRGARMSVSQSAPQ